MPKHGLAPDRGDPFDVRLRRDGELCRSQQLWKGLQGAVLCYLDRPNVHFNPKYFAKTRYVQRAYTVDDCNLELIVGEAYSVDDVVRVEDLNLRCHYF